MNPTYGSIMRSIGLSMALDAVASPTTKPALDDAAIGDAAATYATQYIRLQAVAAVQTWVDSEIALGKNEGSADRLTALLISVADQDQSGELDEAEQAVYMQAAEDAWSYLSAVGVPDEDLELLFNGEDPDECNAAGERIQEFLADAIPDGDEGAQTSMDDFAFGGPATESAFDAAYRTKFAVRGGKKMKVRKRISGTVVRSAEQKMATKKMQRKSHGAGANARRKKSVRVRKSHGM